MPWIHDELTIRVAVYHGAVGVSAAAVLDDFGQDISVEVDASGRPTRAPAPHAEGLSDRPSRPGAGIYSLAYIQPAVMLNDIRTLHLELHTRPADARTAARRS